MVRFSNRIIAAEPKARFAGINPSTSGGYHWDVIGLLADRGQNTTDYSYRLAADRVSFNREYFRAVDISFTDAVNGDYRTISKYGRRIEAAFHARDPRLNGWREVLICIDGVPRGFDFSNWTERRPDSSHLFHGHFSAHTQWVDLESIYIGMGDILLGVPSGGGSVALDEQTDNWAFNSDQYGYGLHDLHDDIPLRIEGQNNPSLRSKFVPAFKQLCADVAIIKASAGLVLSEEQLDALADVLGEKLVTRVDNPLGDDDLPTIKQGLREVLREGTGV